MMKLRRRPLSVYNASPDSVSNQSSNKRQRKYSNRSVSDNESDIENQSPNLTSDGEIDDDDDDRSSGIQTRSITAAKKMNHESDDDGMWILKKSFENQLNI